MKKYYLFLFAILLSFASHAQVGPISGGSPFVCIPNSSTAPFTCTPAGGAWSVSDPSLATVSPSGWVYGISAGTVTLTYTVGSSYSTLGVPIHPSPVVTGDSCVFFGSTITLTGSPAGGAWTSGSPIIATVSAGGVVYPNPAGPGGPVHIVYASPSGCANYLQVTVNAACISGPRKVCQGATAVLTPTPAGGTWSSGNPAVATIDPSGTVSGVSVGVSLITYTMSGSSFSIISFTVNPVPSPISCGATGCIICIGAATTLSSSPAGGAWTSSTPSVATIGSGTGIVTGALPGTSLITYTMPTGCFVNHTVTVTASPGAITGAAAVCISSSTVLSCTPPAGSGPGVWSCSPSSVAIISSAGSLTGESAGIATVTYTIPSGCFVTRTITVNPYPVITGASGGVHLCVGSSLTLSATPAGGTWACSPASVATIGLLSGTATGVSAGSATITYTVAGGCATSAAASVNPGPGPITGLLSLCTGSNTTLSCSPAGGSWSCTPPSIAIINASSGLLTTVSAGSATVTYTLPTGCATTTTVTDAIPSITGPSVLCPGAIASLAGIPSGGAWSSSDPTVATISASTGVVGSVSPGTAIITHTVGDCSTTKTITVSPAPDPFTLTGGGSYCNGNDTVVVGLDNSEAGVTYKLFCSGFPVGTSISGTGAAISFGTETAAGTYTATGTNTAGCTTSMTGTVSVINVGPSDIACPVTGCTACIGQSTLLTEATTGGTWSCSNSSIATVGTGIGVVTGVATGTVAITYKLSNGCYNTTNFVVAPSPEPIIGPQTVCVASTIRMNDAFPAGRWACPCANASINSITGVVMGISAGPCGITYTIPGGCFTTYAITVDPCTSGVHETASAGSDATIFPNPATEELTIRIAEGTYSSFTLTNSIGQVVISQKLSGVETSIPVAALPSAVYCVVLKGEHGILVRRFVKD